MVLGIFFGEVASVRFASGFHHLPSANGAKILEIRVPRNAQGVYKATVEISGVAKRDASSFFPDHWSQEKIVEAIEDVRLNGKIDPEDIRTVTKIFNGVNIKVVFFDNVNKVVKTAYPVL